MIPYIFGHRGASGYEIENTIPSFKKAVRMGAGIETDIQITKDNKLICLHDPYFRKGKVLYRVNNLTFKEINHLIFEEDNRIPLVKDLFKTFKDFSNELRYSFDIADKEAGVRLIHLAKEASILDKIEITDRRLMILSQLRKQNGISNLVHTLPENISKISNKPRIIEKLRKLDINVVNVRCKKMVDDLFTDIIDNGFKCYIWGVNTKVNMKRVIHMRYKDKIVEAIYTDYPDKVLNLIREYYK